MDIPRGYHTLQDICRLFSLKEHTVRSLIKKGMLPRTIRVIKNKRYLINTNDMKQYLSSEDITDYIDISTVSNQIDLHPETIRDRIRKGRIKNYKLFSNKYYIHKNEMNLLSSELKLREEYLGIQEVASLLKCHHETVRKLIRENKFPNLLKKNNGRLFLIPQSDISNYKKELAFKKTCVGKNAAAKKLNVGHTIMGKLLEQNAFPNAIKHPNGTWSIPLKDINNINLDHYITGRYKPINANEFTNLDAINKVKFELKKVKIPSHLEDTYRLYINFMENRFSNSTARGDTLEKKSVYITNTLKYLLKHLTKNITLYSDSEIESFLNQKGALSYIKENFVSFLAYCKKTTLCLFNNKYSIANKISKEALPYTKDEFFDYYKYIKKTYLHIEGAINSSAYCQTWLFIIMHFINAWRKSDIIYELPNIEIESIGISSVEYFNTRKLTFAQSQLIANQVYLKVDKMDVSKTGALGQFLCPKDMVVPFATAAVIAELHRRKNNKNKVLSSIKNGIYENFFKHSSTLKNFNSLKMNHSLLTYFFDYVMQETEDADIAYELSRNLRSHISEDTTMIYIHSTNKDGHINRVSSHLFRRGHFGWLYNSMIKIAELKHFNLENKTKMIEKTRQEFSPIQFESLSYSLVLEQKQPISVIQRLLLLSQEELKIKINEILRGELPAKIKNAQCFVYPHCSKSHDCFSCEFLIPKDYFLFSIDNEIKKLVRKISTTTRESMRIKYGYLLVSTLSILNQAVVELGKEYVKTFLNLQDIEAALEDINEYLELTSNFMSLRGK